MKTNLRLITLALLPLFSGSLARAQDDQKPEPTAETKAAADATKAQFDAHRQDYERKAQQYRAQSDLTLGGDQPQFSQRLQSIISRAPGTTSKPLVIRSSDMNPKDQANLEEDLAVMAHILSKALDELPGKTRTYTAMGIDVAYGLGASPMRTLYLEGYGALFTLNVGFPLLPPPPRTEAKKVESEVDPAWEEAKQELYGQHPGVFVPGGPTEEFSEEKANKLKETILESLKSAANIRDLKADDSVTVCVMGAASSGPATYKKPMTRATDVSQPNGWLVGERRDTQRGTMMTIRVKKADADAFAKGKLDFDEFRRHARIETYAGAVATGGGLMGFGGGSGGGNFSRGGAGF